MCNSIIEHERIITTIQKAKHIKPIIEKLVTLGKVDTTAHRRQAFADLRDKEMTSKLFEVLGPRFANRPGGYCRILKLAKPRLGDNGQRVLIEFVERSVEEDAPVVEVAAAE